MAVDVMNLEPGTVLLDKYRVVGPIGAGGMGVVVCCDHVSLGTRVALKFLLPQHTVRSDSSTRFVREARAATRITSDHIARVLDVGTIEAQGAYGGLPYMVMEFLEGEDMASRIRHGADFEVLEAIDYIVQAAHALASAHLVGIIHRDVKPANLFLTKRPDGTPLVKVLDFGISKVVEGDQDLGLTKTTTVLGSGLYMSPEQMRSAKNVDHRTDIYALGICLYELLTRTQPFTAESFSELVMKVNLDPPDPLRKHRPDISEELAAAIGKAHARHPDERYQSIAAFVAGLAPFAAAETQAKIDAVIRIGKGSRPDLANLLEESRFQSMPPGSIAPPSMPPSSMPPGSSSFPRPRSVPPPALTGPPPPPGSSMPPPLGRISTPPPPSIHRPSTPPVPTESAVTATAPPQRPASSSKFVWIAVLGAALCAGAFLAYRANSAIGTSVPTSTPSKEAPPPPPTHSVAPVESTSEVVPPTPPPTVSVSASVSASASAKKPPKLPLLPPSGTPGCVSGFKIDPVTKLRVPCL